MTIKHKLYPYPVLGYFTDDYINSEFGASVSVAQNSKAITISVDISLDNEELLYLVDLGVVEYVCHIECPKTSYREIVKSKFSTIVSEIPQQKLNHKVEICTFIVAKNEIEFYRNKSFNPDYDNQAFHIERGNVLAYAKQSHFIVDNDIEEFSSKPSIFSIIKGENTKITKFIIDSPKIKIVLSPQNYYDYQMMTNRYEFMQATHAMIIFPALIYAMEKIKSDGAYNYADNRWFVVIKNKLLSYGVDIESESFQCEDSFEVAQKCLEMPIDRAFSSIVNTMREEVKGEDEN